MKEYIKEKMLAQNRKYLLAYKNGCLILRNTDDLVEIRKHRIHSHIKSITIVERLLRYEPRAAVSINDNCFFYSDHGAIYKYDIKKDMITRIHNFARGMNNPLSFCNKRDRDGNIIEIVYGEYIWNENKGPVSIYKYDLNEWKEVYSFPPNSVVHVHNVIYDSIHDEYIILTGDSDTESAIWKADCEFKNVERIAGGAQKYRACIAYPTETGIFYATDTPIEQNYLYFLRNDGMLEKVYQMPGPCIYGCVYKEALYMATSVEGDPTLGGWKYRLSNRLGKGINDRRVHIIKCDNAGNVSEIGVLNKDVLPMWLFQFGNAQFPQSYDGVYISTQSTVEKGTFKLE